MPASPHYGTAFRFLGWLLTAAGIVYLLLGGRGLLHGTALSWPLTVLGLVAVVVGTSVLRWVRRGRPGG